MKADNELLVLAAKAAGVSVEFDDDWYIDEPIGGYSGEWNPLEDDGDALRLAVHLGIAVDNPYQYNTACATVETKCSYCGGDYKETFAEISNCTFSSVRRAIVLAAAKIGENME